MNIRYIKQSGLFHLSNNSISYIMKIMENRQLGQVYFGRRITGHPDFHHRDERMHRTISSYPFENDTSFSLEHILQEFPSYGTSDFRMPALEIQQENGSLITSFVYSHHQIYHGKPDLPHLPATYGNETDDVMTLEIHLKDTLIQAEAILYYSIFRDYAAIARSVNIINHGAKALNLTTVMSMCLDLPDSDYEMIHFSGAWAREREKTLRHLEPGIQSIGSLRRHSSHQHNPFFILKRPSTTEHNGDAFGFALLYSGNFLAQIEVDGHHTSRIMAGIHPAQFTWHLEPSESFQTPEAILCMTNDGLNSLSQNFHGLYRRHLIRGYWKERSSPILLNSWEAAYFNFTEESLLSMAKRAYACGVELFVLDDGWFGTRDNDKTSLGDWFPDIRKLPEGISGFSEKIHNIGLLFGLWIEPEMISKDSALFLQHPDWLIQTPGRTPCHGRNQYVLDFSRKEVRENIFRQIDSILSNSNIDYLKWDMNRSITDCFSALLPAYRQQEVFHRYILGVYELYERILQKYPKLLIESCSGGGGRFDPGMLYYAPQGWISDNTDAIDRLTIQYNTSMGYPLRSMGSHVSSSPNHQAGRTTPLETRANVAYFGTFGYELDFSKLSDEECGKIKEQILFMKKYQSLIHTGSFYRLLDPQGNNRMAAWMVVSKDGSQALVAYYRLLNEVNAPYHSLKLHGLSEKGLYRITPGNLTCYGDELMYAGFIISDNSCGRVFDNSIKTYDFYSRIFILERL